MSKNIEPKELEKLKVSEIIEEFNLSFNKISRHDIESSGKFDAEIRKEYKKQLPKMIKFLKSQDSTSDKMAVKNNKEHILKECVDKIYRKHKNLPDFTEQREVEIVLSRVSDKYNMRDARVYIIIKQLIEMILSVYRIQKQALHLPTLLERMNEETGESVYYNNPSLKLKLEHNMAIVKLISELNKIIEGEKHTNLNLNATVDFRQEMIDAYSEDVQQGEKND